MIDNFSLKYFIINALIKYISIVFIKQNMSVIIELNWNVHKILSRNINVNQKCTFKCNKTKYII